MKTKIQQKITDLNAEIEQLITIRDQLSHQLSDINARITQIVGAIKALDEILDEGAKDEKAKAARNLDQNEHS